MSPAVVTPDCNTKHKDDSFTNIAQKDKNLINYQVYPQNVQDLVSDYTQLSTILSVYIVFLFVYIVF